MCLTIPKKVLEISENGVVVETYTGDRQTLKSVIKLDVGDFILSQQNMIIEKMDAEMAGEILKILRHEEV